MILNSYLLKDGTSSKKFMKINKFDEDTSEYIFNVSYCNQEGFWSDYLTEQYSELDLTRYIFLPGFSFRIDDYNMIACTYEKGDVRIDAIRSAGSQNRSVATTGTQRNKLNPKAAEILDKCGRF